MPEGDVVWYTARRLDQALAGRTLTRSDFRVPGLATADLTGDVVTGTVSRGKHLLTRTGNGLTIHTHLKMDGDWRVRPAAEQIRDSHRIRLLLANKDWQAIGYQLGVVELIRTNEESRVTGHLGPDLLGPDWDCAEAVQRLSAEPDRPVGEALLDQRNLAGVNLSIATDARRAAPARRRCPRPGRAGRRRDRDQCGAGADPDPPRPRGLTTRHATRRRRYLSLRPCSASFNCTGPTPALLGLSPARLGACDRGTKEGR